GRRGKVMPRHWPSLLKTSLWQTPQAWTLIRTDPGPGSGIGRSTRSRGPPGRETWATRIVAMRMFISVACGVTVGVTVSPGLLFVRLGNTNADDRLPLASLGPVEGGDGIVEGRDVADVRPQSSVPYPLDELTQLGAIGYDDEVDSQAARGPRLGRAGNGHQRSSGANHARRPLRDVAAEDIENQIDPADIFQGVVIEVD